MTDSTDTAFDADVIVVGGGLAGSITALPVARAGAKVIVVEKASFPRHKVCGEGLLPHGVGLLKKLELDHLLDECQAQPFSGILYRAYGVWAPGDFADGQVGYGIQRYLLDDKLHQSAIAHDNVTLVKDQVRGLAHDDDGVTVTTRKGDTYRARVLVGADGVRSTTRHLLGLDKGPPKRQRYGLRRHFRLRDGVALPRRVEVNVLDGFELFITPVEPGVMGVAALMERHITQQGKGSQNDRLDALLQHAPDLLRERLEGATPVNDAKAVGPLMADTKEVHQGRCVLVGDAAGFVDAITGEGMTIAFATADTCAAAVLDVLNGEAPAAAFGRYAKMRHGIYRDHKILTLGLLTMAGRPAIIRRAVTRLKDDPQLFTDLLNVNNGTHSIWSFGLWNMVKLGLGKTPPRVFPTEAGLDLA